MADFNGIIRISDEQEYGLAHRYIFGLNLFHYNHVPCSIEERPDVRFLKRVTEQTLCSAQVAAVYLQDRVDSPVEMFGWGDESAETPYTQVKRIGFSDAFFDLDGGISFGGEIVDGNWIAGTSRYGDCFFPRCTSAFWESLERTEGDLAYLLLSHGLVLYVGLKGMEASDKISQLLNRPFAGQGAFLQAATNHYSVTLLVGHDGQFLHAYAKAACDFAILDQALTEAVQAVEDSDWFRQHRESLRWRSELDCCLMLQT